MLAGGASSRIASKENDPLLQARKLLLEFGNVPKALAKNRLHLIIPSESTYPGLEEALKLMTN